MTVQRYIEKNEISGKMAEVIRDYDKGRNPLYEICWFHGVNIDEAIYHINAIR